MKILRLMSSVFLLVCCMSAQAGGDAIALGKPVPYAEDNEIAGNIKAECDLGNQLATFVAQYSGQGGIAVSLQDGTPATETGKVLNVQITNAISSGNALLGHSKSVTVKGKLLENGKVIGSFKGMRLSSGGAFGVYKSSCAVLGRCVEALGKDIAGWLAAPSEAAMLGDLK